MIDTLRNMVMCCASLFFIVLTLLATAIIVIGFVVLVKSILGDGDEKKHN